MQRTNDTRRAVIPLAAALCSLLAAGCARKEAPAAPPPPTVATVTAVAGSVTPKQTLAGIIAPYQNVAIQSSLTEPALRVNVQEGDRVRRGEVLAQLDTADLEATLAADLATAASNRASTSHTVYQGTLTIAQGQDALRGADAAVRSAQATLEKDQTDLNRYRQLASQGYVSQQQYDAQAATVRTDEQTLRSATSSLASAQSNVAANGSLGTNGNGLQATSVAQSQATEQVALAQAEQERVQIAKATIVSPIDGVVVNRNLNPGEYPGTRQLFTLQQVDPVYAVLRGSGAQIAQIDVGATATIVVSDLRNARERGRVAGVLNQIAPGSTDFQVKVLVPNPTGRLRPGMAVASTVTLPPVRGVRIPETAFTDDSHAHVLVVGADDTVKTVTVAEAGTDGKNAVVSGLAPGERVIGDGQTSVGNGQKVAVR